MAEDGLKTVLIFTLAFTALASAVTAGESMWLSGPPSRPELASADRDGPATTSTPFGQAWFVSAEGLARP